MGGRGGPALQKGGTSAAPAASLSPEARVRQAFMAARQQGDYGRLGTRANGEYVSIADVRDALGEMTRDQQDSLLIKMYRSGEVSIIPEEFQRALTLRQREGGISFGDQRNHLIRFEGVDPLPRD